MLNQWSIQRDEDGQLTAYAWPGGYPVFHLTSQNACLCPECANKLEQSNNEYIAEVRDENNLKPTVYESVIASDINYEDTSLYCDECSKQIESAYGDDSDDSDETE